MQRSRKKEKRTNRYWLYLVGGLVSVLLIGSVVWTVWSKQENVKEHERKNEQLAKEIATNPDPKPEPAPPTKEDTAEKTDNGYIEGQAIPQEPSYIKGVLIASKKYPLPSTFAPGEDPEAKKMLNEMLNNAKKAGFTLQAFSGYRSYEYQTTLYDNYVKRDGKDAADRYSARPGYSEHQTGLVYDIGEVGREDVWLTEAFGETPAGQWLRDHAHEYGFIMRYPKGKEDVTGYMYESWHFRYVGTTIASEIFTKQSTLEEYLGIE